MSRAASDAALEQAMGRHQRGDLVAAERLYRRALALDAGNDGAHAYLGLALHHRGATGDGIASLRRAIALAPGDAAHHANLGVVLIECGDTAGALEAWSEVVRLDPSDADAHFHVGLVLGDLGRHDESEASLRRAAEGMPGDAAVHAALAGALRARGKADEALAVAERALGLDPRSASAMRQRGAALAALGRRGDAARAYRQALEVDAGHAPTWHNLAVLMLDGGQPADGLAAFDRARVLDPGAVSSIVGAARALAALGRQGEALARCREALDESPHSRGALDQLATLLRRVDAGGPDAGIERDLARCLASDQVDWQSLAGAAARALRYRLGDGVEACADPGRAAPVVARLGAERLWLDFLSRVVNVDARMEQVIAAARRCLLDRVAGGDALDAAETAHAGALAMQAFYNEYVVAPSADEAVAVERIAARVGKGAGAYPGGAAAFAGDLLVFSAYRSPETLPAAVHDELLGAGPDLDPALAALLAHAVTSPLVEAKLAAELPSIAPIEDDTSQAVRAQYEENPYPRWRTVAAGPETSIDEMLERLFPGFEPAPALRGAPDVLVAGCGTGREAIDIATSCPGTRVTAVDLSRRSLAYARRMADELGVDTVDFAQGDILGLGALDRTFPAIVSTGVLHHMADPRAGWAVLASLLEPGGVMRVGLYSRRARTPVEAAREEIARRGVAADPASIAAFRAEILSGEAGPALAPLAGSEDLFTTSACRDLLFHVCEHTFDPPGISEALDALGLDFLGFEIPDPAVDRAFRAANPDPGALRDLEAWERFEAEHPEAFVGMYQFWCVKRRA